VGNYIKEETDIPALIENAREQINKEANLSPGIKALVELLIAVIQILAGKRIAKNSKNSDVPPSMDPNREKKPKEKAERKPGGQPGHAGITLQQCDNPDEIITLKVDRDNLPVGIWKYSGYEKRQIFDMKIVKHVTEYRAEILVNEAGEKVTAEFPEGLVQKAQYGNGVKAHSVYMSVKQLIPCERVSEHFSSQMGLPLSAGTVHNFKEEAYNLLEPYEEWVKEQIRRSKIIHGDETGIAVEGKRTWLHVASNKKYTFYYPHGKRGKEAMDEAGVFSGGSGILIHDHWKPYYSYVNKEHGLCNAHYLRELTAAEEEGQKWPRRMAGLLTEANKQTDDAGGTLALDEQRRVRKKYRKILTDAEKENPVSPRQGEIKRGRVAQTKTRNLINRMRDYEGDILRFMTDVDVPFTNNQAERDIRMAKVQQKISGSFRSWDGAKYFCRIRGYLSTCEKQNISSSDALKVLYNGKFPDFMSNVAE
jgi:transposase